MRISVFLGLYGVLAAATPLQIRDGPGGLASLFGGFDLSSLMKGLDISSLMSNMNFEKFPISGDTIKQFSGIMTRLLATQKIHEMKELKPLLRPEAKRVKIIYGPYVIKGTDTKTKTGNSFSMDPSGSSYMYTVGDDFPRDITIIDVKSGVFDEQMEPIDIGKGLYNHHNVLFDASQSNPAITSCGSGAGFGIPISIFVGGATESTTMPFTSIDGKFNSGYYLAKDAKIASMLDVVNYNKDSRTVYTISEIEYLPGKIAGALPASSQVFDIGMCSKGASGLSVHAPEGQKKWTINGNDITITKSGYFLASKAHFHDGGVNMVVYLNGKEICDSKAEYGGPGREGVNPDGTPWKGIAGTTACDKVTPVKAGDKIRLVANFDIEKHPERQFEKKVGGHDEMGMAEGMALFTASFALQEPGKN